MPTRRTLLFIAASLLVMPWGIAAPAAADPAAVAFVTKLFDVYKGKRTKGIATTTEADLLRYFEPSLVALIKERWATAKVKGGPLLSFDPIITDTEWDFSAFNIAVTDVPPDKAVATVTFKNYKMPMKIVLNLVKVKNDWRVADIISEEKTYVRQYSEEGATESLRDAFKH